MNSLFGFCCCHFQAEMKLCQEAGVLIQQGGDQKGGSLIKFITLIPTKKREIKIF